jgi:hypothetical protein
MWAKYLIVVWIVASAAAIPSDDNDPRPEFIEFTLKSGIPKEEREIFESIQKRRRVQYDALLETIDDFEAELPKTEKGVVRPTKRPGRSVEIKVAKGNWTFPSKEAKAKAIYDHEALTRHKLRSLEMWALEPAGEISTIDRRPPVGHFGRFETGIRVTQVVSKSEIIADTGDVAGTVWIEHIDASKLIDGDPLTVPWPVYVSGTKSYTNALEQTRTILLMHPIEIEKLVEKSD